MKDKLEQTLEQFLSDDEENDFDEKVKEQKKELLNTKTGLIERIDRIFVDSSGRQLLREQY